MKTNRFIIFALTLTFASSEANAQPLMKLRPDETVLLYSSSFEDNVDPHFGKEIKYAGFEMKEKNGSTKNVSDMARMDMDGCSRRQRSSHSQLTGLHMPERNSAHPWRDG